MSRTLLIFVAAAVALVLLVVIRRASHESDIGTEIAAPEFQDSAAPLGSDRLTDDAAGKPANRAWPSRSTPQEQAKPQQQRIADTQRGATGFAATIEDRRRVHPQAGRGRSNDTTTAVAAAPDTASGTNAFGARRRAAGADAPLITDSGATVEGADPAASDAAKDDSLLLSLPFDKSSQPDKGDEPFVADGVKIDENGAQFSSDSQFAVTNPGLKGDVGTISFWVRPEDLGTEGTDNSLVQLREQNQYENRIQIGMTPKHLSFMLADNNGAESPTGTDVAWQPGTWYQVTATWGDQTTRLYVDGQKVSENTYSGDLQIHPTTPLYIGSDYPGQMPGPRGSLRNFQVYNRTQNPDEIAQQAAIRPR